MPVPYFFQNLAEAEYVVTLYQYMRLLGYPADKISMLTTYNGQKALLKDVVERRCAHHPAFGVPHKVSLQTDTHGDGPRLALGWSLFKLACSSDRPHALCPRVQLHWCVACSVSFASFMPCLPMLAPLL